MKYPITLLLIALLVTQCFAQEGEFGKLTNGLIYPDTTIRQLKYIVDSLNLKFKICDLTKVYQSKLQSKAHFVSFEKGNIKAAKKDMDAHMSFDDFIKKYSKATVDTALLVVKYRYKNADDKEEVEFNSMELNKGYEHELSFDTNLSYYDQPVKGKWVYRYWDKTKYTPESIDAFYFIEDFHQQPIPEIYARMIQYSECMVDTSTQVFYEKAQRSGIRYASNQSANKVQQLISYVHTVTHKPEYKVTDDSKAYDAYREQYQLWDSLRLYRVDSLQQHDDNFGKLFSEAVAEALGKGNTGDEFEEYVGRYYSKKAELELKRNRRVVGMCSQDNSPRIHALNIAKLSAETVNWEIFLRSHLDIMNDRFERATDGSYAWGRRKTYIKELEVLDINVLDLLLGISLRVENPSRNHYYGSIGRLGRALSETDKQEEIEAKMLQMIGDNQLDDLNRILIYYLFLSYNYNLDNIERQAVNKEKLAAAVKTLPEYLASKIVVK